MMDEFAKQMPPATELLSGSATARKAATLLTSKNAGFMLPTASQKKNLVVAFAKRDMIIYGKAFDCVHLSGPVDLNTVDGIDANFDRVTIVEIKSTRKNLGTDFAGFFFSMSGAEVLVAQSLRERFKFAFVNVNTGAHIELSLTEIFSRARGIYQGWSILF